MEIEAFEIANDILTVCVVAPSFPMGIKTAYDKLNKAVGMDKPRELYGVTAMVDGGIVYRACVNKLDGDDALRLDEYTIQKGKYLATLFEWEGNEHQFGQIFSELAAHPDAKPGSIGLERYYVTPKEARLMVQAV
ncbi:MAG: hypothetical protein EOP51_20825 [Sphingobacteriales bacterium]|nr:MAG: hypothetical protein EOP51_20825 [Sphingobacteriales bacterium]